MKDCRPTVLSRFNDVQSNTVDLLRRTDQLRPLVRRLLIEESTQELNPPEELLKQALANHCQQEQLNNEEALECWLSERFISKDELLLQLSLPLKLSKLALDAFAAKAEARFSATQRRARSSHLQPLEGERFRVAHELYLQLEAW